MCVWRARARGCKCVVQPVLACHAHPARAIELAALNDLATGLLYPSHTRPLSIIRRHFGDFRLGPRYGKGPDPPTARSRVHEQLGFVCLQRLLREILSRGVERIECSAATTAILRALQRGHDVSPASPAAALL